jgi:hypothetical protein
MNEEWKQFSQWKETSIHHARGKWMAEWTYDGKRWRSDWMPTPEEAMKQCINSERME